MNKPKLTVFASGSKTGGGSGFENLVKASRNGILDAEIRVVSSRENTGVKKIADELGVPFTYSAGPWTKETYQELAKGSDFVALSGWLKLVTGLDPRTTFNIHPGPLPRFGGERMYGHYVHEAVIEAFNRGEITHSAVTMHFVTEKFDEGPVFFRKAIEIIPGDTADSLSARVNTVEHLYQPIVTDAVLKGKIWWDGKNPDSLHSIYI
ncbi:hypothetical protein H0W91_00260 [Patescibacteria group bacterium]|nr:hypothetical protein [Patescibacteria group bacterium]